MSEQTDLQLQANIEHALDADQAAHSVAVYVEHGVALLNGRVGCTHDLGRVEQLVAAIPGVTGVVDNVELPPPGTGQPDAAIAAAVASELARDGVPGGRIKPIVRDGHVVLVGTVPTGQDRRTAAHAARRVGGIASVTNEVEIRRGHRRKTESASPPDADLS